MNIRKRSLNAATASKALQNTGCVISKTNTDLFNETGLIGYKKTEYLECLIEETKVRIYLLHFEKVTQAIETATILGLKPWPEGEIRIGFAHGKVVAEIFGNCEEEASILQISEALHLSM